ncbi:ATP-dependent Clp protease adaptor ClpS [Longimicrobium terrae]|uniref:ATP-dependent Clp protease adapter protein ClpS n=1 Tax=Longimicrobium terrae TaxID=1639882 RepID=A0A841H240_9BACT|nr:ATP-dependent Clp protease adaptor ClpS [Longimicrobium terrae]MBB4637666.1 ATP-dependent Clp protease adaptor protein ClpS [Longimicrobium terrae]MBB6072063.1 ATP-dependent Clp protease adaptor protein ClpS [Longimicrobium terrae]NNC29853.1 ATP-dependent Clp protease adaptor ClpS [Longimicrobium terrae]
MSNPDVPAREGQPDLAVQERTRTAHPRMYRVMLHNDDYTTMEYVVDVLMRHFGRSEPEALRIMLQVHHKGAGVAGVFTRDEAETRAAEVMDEARGRGFPLRLTTEPE